MLRILMKSNNSKCGKNASKALWAAHGPSGSYIRYLQSFVRTDVLWGAAARKDGGRYTNNLF